MVIKLYEKNNNPKDLARIVEVLEEGGIIIYPTDTMYAIGCHALKERAIEHSCTRLIVPMMRISTDMTPANIGRSINVFTFIIWPPPDSCL